jgi:hypothetical protein
MLKTLRETQKNVLNSFADFLPPIQGRGFMHTQKAVLIAAIRRKASIFCASDGFGRDPLGEYAKPESAFMAITPAIAS